MVNSHRRAPNRRRRAILVVLGVVVVSAVVAAVIASNPKKVGGQTVTTTSTSTPLASSTTTTLAPTITIAAVGDSELGNTPSVPSNPLGYLQPIKNALAAPIVFGNLEGTMTNATTSKCSSTSTNCYAFRVPTSFAAVYRRVGFTVLNSANNHSHDYGNQGALDTSAALRAAGIVQAGLPGQIGVTREGPVRVAFVDFAPYSNTNNLLDFPEAAALIRRAKSLASVVVVYMHAGAEGESADHVTRQSETYVGENRGNPYAFAHAAVDDGADLVIASGPHVLRGMEWYRGHLIDYSLGDFANDDNFSASGDLALSAILHVTLSSQGRFVSAHFTSVRLSTQGQPFIDPSNGAAVFVNKLSIADFGSDAALIEGNGVVAPRR